MQKRIKYVENLVLGATIFFPLCVSSHIPFFEYENKLDETFVSVFFHEDYSESVKKLISTRLIKPLDAIHDPAYVIPKWEYTLYNKPSASKKYYKFELREKKGPFIVAQYEFRVYEKTGRIVVLNLAKKKLIDASKWLKEYEVYYNKFGKTAKGC